MRVGRYKVCYNGYLVEKVWSLNKAYELISNMVNCGYDKEKFTIDYTDIGLAF